MPQIEKLRVRVEDGVESEAALFVREQGQPARAIIVCTPAMGVPARFYEPLAHELADRGLCAVTAELRGIGSSSVRVRRGVDFGYHELALRDLPAVISAARGVYPEAPVFVLGHSLGGQVSALYASAHPEAVRGLILVASGTPYFRNWRFPGNLGVLVGTQLMRGLSSVLGYYPGRRFGFGGTEARRLIREWTAFAARGRLRVTQSPHDTEARLQQFSRPLLAISFDDDPLAPRPAVDHLLSKMPRAELTRWHLRPSEVGVQALNHFQWAKRPAPVAELIGEWIRAR
ncbi:MAG: alpha/beta fold hydrolase [Hyalangium sp.]|uniref:alpha/beta hydrolase family protein n=1 Tax=Hyalangium sp. TaxID=2028555 RepID=UPI00389AF925